MHLSPTSKLGYLSFNNEKQIITGYPIDGAMGSSGEWRFRELSVICLHNNATVARCILVTILHYGTPEPRLNTIYIASSVGTSLLRLAFWAFLTKFNNDSQVTTLLSKTMFTIRRKRGERSQ